MQSPGGGRSAHSRECAWVGCCVSHGMVLDPDGWSSSPCFPDQRRSRQPPRPRRGRGSGGGGRTDHRPQAAQGGGAAKAGAGRGRPGERRSGPPDRAAPERSPPDPQGRAGQRTPNPTKRLSFVRLAGDRAPGQLLTKLAFCWCSSGRSRRRTLAAERSAPTSRKSSEKRVRGASAMGGYYDTPP